VREGRSLLHYYREGLEGYTYLEEAEPEVQPAAPVTPDSSSQKPEPARP